MGRSSDKCSTEAIDVGAGKESLILLCVPVSQLEILIGLGGSEGG